MTENAGRLSVGAVLLCLGAATLLGLQIPVSKLAYQQGADPFGFVLIRVITAVSIFLPAAVLMGRSLKIPRAAWPALVAVTLANLGIGIGYLGAAARIAGSLAALILYLFPLIVLVADSILRRRVPGPRRIAVGVGAFIGLAVVFGPAFDSLDPIGVGLACLAAVSAATFMMTAGDLQDHMSGVALMVWSNLFHIPIFGALVLSGSGALPSSGEGWIFVGIGAACFSAGLSLTFLAVRAAGSVRSSIIFNIEPVAVALASFPILGELLSLQQYFGMALVVACVAIATALREH